MKFFGNHPAFDDHFAGVFRVEDCPSLEARQCAILNFRRHWIAIVKVDGETAELFDPLGSTEPFCRSYFKKFKVKLRFNKHQYQQYNTDTCGHFCCFFLWTRLQNIDKEFDDVLSLMFGENLFENEQNVKTFYSRWS